MDKVWELWGEDTVSDNDTSGKAARSEKMVRYSNEAVTRQLLQDFWIKVDEKE